MSIIYFFFILSFHFAKLKSKIINLEYTLEPKNICDNRTFLFIYVHSSPGNLKNRLKIRETWGNLNYFTQNEVKILFTSGLAKDKKVNDLLKLESEIYNDILQANFTDTYRNLTIKGISTLKWLGYRCNNVPYVLKVDDDVYVKTKLLKNHLKIRFEDEKEEKSSILCYVHNKMKVIRDKKSKWFVSPKEFANKYYSKYCSGSAFVITKDAVKKISQNSHRVKFFWVDDYFLTGRVAKILRINLVEFNSVYILNTDKSKQALSNKSNNFLFAHYGHKRHSIDYF